VWGIWRKVLNPKACLNVPPPLQLFLSYFVTERTIPRVTQSNTFFFRPLNTIFKIFFLQLASGRRRWGSAPADSLDWEGFGRVELRNLNSLWRGATPFLLTWQSHLKNKWAGWPLLWGSAGEALHAAGPAAGEGRSTPCPALLRSDLRLPLQLPDYAVLRSARDGSQQLAWVFANCFCPLLGAWSQGAGSIVYSQAQLIAPGGPVW